MTQGPDSMLSWLGIALLVGGCSDPAPASDGCPQDSAKTAPGICGCGVPDTDRDGDGTPDCSDGCPDDSAKTAPGACGCLHVDDDGDGDGAADCIDQCPADNAKAAPGICGCSVPDTDSDGDDTPDCADGCPDAPGKIEPGICGCESADEDNDSDGVLDCLDICPGFDDTRDADGDAVPDGCDSDAGTCSNDVDCDDGLSCTANVCPVDVCQTTPLFECEWPAEVAANATNLTGIEGPIWDNDFYTDLSGAVWNPVTHRLWLCRNNGPSKIWAVREDGAGSFEIDAHDGNRGEWSDFGDLEGLTFADFNEPTTLYLIVEGQERIKEVDLSVYGTAVSMNDWDTSAHLPLAGGAGAEGITFVPDSYLLAQGFADANGAAYSSALGMGGVMLVGHQNGGKIYAFDLDRSNSSFVFVGEYLTAADETAALEFDRSTGLLYIWHGENHNTLEVARLSSAVVGDDRKLDTVKTHGGPGTVLFGSANHEGIALTPGVPCPAGHRDLFMTTDGGGASSLLWYQQFPCH
ncbi:MAG: hypothetical protein DRI90_24565 [Deltaproteobacteria bacterium]|nr:MAG: hypothetical protein DRI90_24565 [Deltaproteobacteria bacterium]